MRFKALRHQPSDAARKSGYDNEGQLPDTQPVSRSRPEADYRERLLSCRIPDDCIDSKRYPLFMARDVMRVLIEQLQAEGATPS